MQEHLPSGTETVKINPIENLALLYSIQNLKQKVFLYIDFNLKIEYNTFFF